MKRLSKRKLKRYEVADDVCKELRHAIGYGGPGLLKESWDLAVDLLIYRWMMLAGKERYDRAKKRRKLVRN